MLLGVWAYSYAISSISTVIASYDSWQAKLNEKLGILNDIKRDYKIDTELYLRLRKALKYDNNRDAVETCNLLKQLPPNLSLEFSFLMHQNMVETFPFFQNQPSQFVASIGPLLRPIQIMKNEYIYEEVDPIHEIFFLVTGQAGLVLKNYFDTVYIKIDEGKYKI